MTNKVLFAVILSLLFTGVVFGQTDKNKKWTTEFRQTFLNDCFNSAKPIGEDSAKRYCACMAEKLEAMYPDQQKVDKLTKEDFEKPAMKQMVHDCLDMKWPEADRTRFLSECEKSATSLSEEKAKKYCNCMLQKVEAKYVSAKEADKLTAADLEKPEWKALIKSCVQ